MEPLVVIESIGKLDFVLNYPEGFSSSQFIDFNGPINPGMTTVKGYGTKVVTIKTILPSNFYSFAADDAEVFANGLVNFAPSSSRMLVRAKSDTAAPKGDASVSKMRLLQEQQGGFSIRGVTIGAVSEATSGADALVSGSATILAASTVMAAVTLGEYNFW